MFKKPTIIGHYIDKNEDADLRDLLKRAKQLAAINKKIQACLPTILQGRCQVARLRDGQLTLAAESNAWAARIRFAQKQIKTASMHRAGIFLNDIRVVVQQPVRLAAKSSKRPFAQHSEAIQRCASAISDSEIRNMFLEIASLSQED